MEQGQAGGITSDETLEQTKEQAPEQEQQAGDVPETGAVPEEQAADAADAPAEEQAADAPAEEPQAEA